MNKLQNGRLVHRIVAATSTKTQKLYATCPHAAAVSVADTHNGTINEQRNGADLTATFGDITDITPRPYSEVPGPRPLPLLGNTWR